MACAPESIDRLLAEALPPGSLYAVGGRVRDEVRAAIRGVEIVAKDADYVVVGCTYDQLIAALRPLGRVDVVGASFAVAKFTYDHLTVDIALPRRERSTGSGHRDFVVESGLDVTLEEDLARRDFRMNMLARALPSGELIDPYGGVADLRAQRIDILSESSFFEDPLRMLRACQFAARFGYTLSQRTIDALVASAPLVATLSPQRIGEEMTKLLRQAHRPSIGIELMRETGLLAVIWPELLEGVAVEQNAWHAYDVYRHNLETLDAVPPGDLIVRLAALLHDVGKPRVKDGPHFYRHEEVGAELTHRMLERIALSQETIARVVHLVRQHMYVTTPEMTDAAVRRFIRRVGVDALDGLFALRQADIIGSGLPRRDDENLRFQSRVAAELLRRPALSVRDLALKGDAVIAAFADSAQPMPSRGDRRVGHVLQRLLDAVIEDPRRNTAAHLKRMMREMVAEMG